MSRETLICPLCGRTIWSGDSSPILSRASMPSRSTPQQSGAMLTAMMEEANRAHAEKIAAAESATISHFETEHQLRWAIARRFEWEWLMKRRWPWSRVPDFEDFEVKL